MTPVHTFRIETRLVLVDVVVTDRKGEAVAGLTREDFTLKEDDKPQEIAVFDWKQSTGKASPAAPLPPDVYTNEPAYHPPKEPLTLLLLDSLNTPIADQSLMREEILRFLASPDGAGRWVAVLALRDTLEVLQDFTTDQERLRAVVEDYQLEESALYSTRQVMTSQEKRDELQQWRKLAMKACGVDCAIVADKLERFDDFALSESDRRRMELTLAALRAIAQSVVGYPGRKNLVWVSAGFPTMSFLREKWSMDTESRKTARLLNDARLAVYPVDPRGLAVAAKATQPEDADAFNDRMIRARRFPRYDPNLARPSVPSPKDADYYLYSTISAMKGLADNSGGKAFYNRNDLSKAVALALADGSSYYTLGYYPDNKTWDGKFRQIEAKLIRGGLRLRHRRGYYATALQAASAQNSPPNWDSQELMAAFRAALPATGVLFRAYAASPAPSTNNAIKVEFRLRKDSLKTTELPGGGREVDADCVVGSFAPDGRILSMTARRLQRRFSSPEYEALSGLVVPVTLERPRGDFHLRLLVRDHNTGLLGRVDVPFKLDPSASRHR